MVQIDYLILADAAVVAEGKHYIHGGGWDTLHAPSFPVTHPALAVAFRVRMPWQDMATSHSLELDVVDSEGRSILPDPPGPPQGSISVERSPHLLPGDDQVLPLVFNIMNLQITRAGSHAVVLRVDSLEMARARFQIKQLPSQAVH
jgi:hypothetical protein